jgi:hypothetical protein
MDHRLPVSTSTLRAQPGATAPAGERAELVPVHAHLTIHGSTFIHIEPQSYALTWCVHPNDSNQRDDVVRPNDFVSISSPASSLWVQDLLGSERYRSVPMDLAL